MRNCQRADREGDNDWTVNKKIEDNKKNLKPNPSSLKFLCMILSYRNYLDSLDSRCIHCSLGSRLHAGLLIYHFITPISSLSSVSRTWSSVRRPLNKLQLCIVLPYAFEVRKRLLLV